MKTIIKSVTSQDVSATHPVIVEAASLLRAGGLVAFPTETVYGLGGHGLSEKAATKIYQAKNRPKDNPLILHVHSMNEFERYAGNLPDIAYKLADAFWPGPLTLIVPKSEHVPYDTTGGLDSVALRMPSHPIAQALIEACGFPLAAPSANLSGKPSPTTAKHVIKDLDGRIDMIIDGGESTLGLESTIVSVLTEPTILRPGTIIKEMLEEITPIDYAESIKEKEVPLAPGTKYRHYAPKSPMAIIKGTNQETSLAIKKLVSKNHKNEHIGILTSDSNIDAYTDCDAKIVLSLGNREKPEELVKNIFSVLRKFDEYELDYIYAESFYNSYLGHSLMNRLLKAASMREYSALDILEENN